MADHERLCIVSTVRGTGRSILSFVRYHLALGFERIYLFFDDPDDEAIELVRGWQAVTAIPADERLLELQRSSPLYAQLGDHLDRDVAFRQVMNVDTAMRSACAEGMTWMLHIDGDELLYCQGESARDHFARIPQEVESACFLNMEAVPEQLEIQDCFEEVTLFRKNVYMLSEAQRRKLWGDPRLRGRAEFVGYLVGKSAARVSEGVIASNPHHFTRVDRALKRAFVDDAFVLHYPNCGFSNYCKKYEILGDFPDDRMGKAALNDVPPAGGDPSRQSVPGGGLRVAEETDRRAGSRSRPVERPPAPGRPFYLDSRDLIMRGDRRGAQELYLRRVAVCDPAEVKRLLRQGFFVRLEQPQGVLRALAGSTGRDP